MGRPQEDSSEAQQYQYEPTSSHDHPDGFSPQAFESTNYYESTQQETCQSNYPDAFPNDPQPQQQQEQPSQAPPQQQQPYPPPQAANQGYRPQPAQFLPRSGVYASSAFQPQGPQTAPPSRPAPYPPQNSNQPTAYPPQAIPNQPMQFPPVYQNGSNQPAAYPPQRSQQPMSGNYPSQSAPQGFHQNAYQALQPQPQAVSFPPQNNGGQPQGYNMMPASPYKPPVQSPIAAQGIPVGQQIQYNEGWRTGLFDCMDDPMNALITACFPCITFGQVAEIIDNGHTSCGTSGLLYGLVAAFIGLPCIMSCSYRTKLRAKYGLVEAPAPDWLTHFFCEWCALCQEYRELQRRGLDPAIGWQGNVNMQQQPQMVMTPPMNQKMMP